MDGWKTFSFPFGAKGLFSGAFAVRSFLLSNGSWFTILGIPYEAVYYFKQNKDKLPRAV